MSKGKGKAKGDGMKGMEFPFTRDKNLQAALERQIEKLTGKPYKLEPLVWKNSSKANANANANAKTNKSPKQVTPKGRKPKTPEIPINVLIKRELNKFNSTKNAKKAKGLNKNHRKTRKLRLV